MKNSSKNIFEKIREAEKAGLVELDLSTDWGANDSQKLAEIPAEVFDFEQLEVLKLSRNLLRTLPKSITRLRRLKMLDLSSNQLTIVPGWIAQLQNLTSLDLSGNQLSALPSSFPNCRT